jgi:CheY-like chemotaxis protein
VLVVDDQEDVREIVCAHLEMLGYSTVQMASGRGVLDLLRTGGARGIELLLVDYAMPALTGIDIIRAARQARPDLPVVLMTGYADALALGEPVPASVELLKKPYRLHELAAAMENTPRIAREIESGGNVFPLDRTRR